MPGPDAPGPHFVSPGATLRDRFPGGRPPSWLTEDDLEVYTGEFERTGMTGALNRYRNMDRLRPTGSSRNVPRRSTAS
ncbi:hypothetical protein [Nonomuraea sp. MG754425]|uniref:hypothetical protein n=1 Tax=Nonomuraea sp. MG754425 TaxID=2570319 RepID=UPI001F402A9F|nr:hypothetical protein [Nonomuraea sp. MG754425]